MQNIDEFLKDLAKRGKDVDAEELNDLIRGGVIMAVKSIDHQDTHGTCIYVKTPDGYISAVVFGRYLKPGEDPQDTRQRGAAAQDETKGGAEHDGEGKGGQKGLQARVEPAQP